MIQMDSPPRFSTVEVARLQLTVNRLELSDCFRSLADWMDEHGGAASLESVLLGQHTLGPYVIATFRVPVK